MHDHWDCPQSEQFASSKRRGGFTLIELLVVIAIIVLLAAIMFPVFARVREKARRASCQSNLKQIALAFQQYTVDNDGRMPAAWDSDPTLAGTISCQFPNAANCLSPRPGLNQNWFEPMVWPAKIEPYLKSREVYRCPETDVLRRGPCDFNTPPAYAFGWGEGQAVVGSGASNWFTGASTVSYGYNVLWLGGGQFGALATIQQLRLPTGCTGSNCYTTGLGAVESSIAQPAATLLLIDNNFANAGFDAPPAFANLIVIGDSEGAVRCYSSGLSTANYDRWDSFDPRHGGGLNVAYVDGHVKWLPKQQALYRPAGMTYAMVGSPTYGNDDKFIWDRF